ncbi:Glycosyl transferases group 1 [Poriferisphaera corsica]|uniref:tRNA-queuosine alpha-mannosyltransferase n=2 Tax=Poriferisphaera corsica TaxID=2528020 RepID=A0A517YZI7_9BACT|nr:Glycosyl transferases group 1 [Poriferisphaera corsica]
MLNSRHNIIALTLPGYAWKWRIRHAGITFANHITRILNHLPIASDTQVKCISNFSSSSDTSSRRITEHTLSKQNLEHIGQGGHIFSTSMMNLADFRATAPALIAQRPMSQYFHENQFAYPLRSKHGGDVHFGISQIISAHTALQSTGHVIFNSTFNRDTLLNGFHSLNAKAGKLKHVDWDFMADHIQQHAMTIPPGINYQNIQKAIQPTPHSSNKNTIHLAWAGRWEHDKRPDLFFEAIKKLQHKNLPFKISVLGESFSQVPDCFQKAKTSFADNIVHWGYQPTAADYFHALSQADLFISTADHEFFGLAVAEAAAAGCGLLLPRALAYPEIWGAVEGKGVTFYDTPESLPHILQETSERFSSTSKESFITQSSAADFDWLNIAHRLDRCFEA